MTERTDRLHQDPGEWQEQHWNLLHQFYVAMQTAGLPVSKITVETETTVAGMELDGPRLRRFGGHNDSIVEQLHHVADSYLHDAANEELSTHTRFSAAMDALRCLHLAEDAPDADLERVNQWEAARYEPDRWPTPDQVAELIAYVAGIRTQSAPKA